MQILYQIKHLTKQATKRLTRQAMKINLLTNHKIELLQAIKMQWIVLQTAIDNKA